MVFIKLYFKKLLIYLFKYELEKVSSLKGKGNQSSCYIFGDGVSLKWFDLEKFSDKPSIVLSFLVFHKDYKKLNVILNLLTEPFYFYPFVRQTINNKKWKINKIQERFRIVIDENENVPFLLNISNYFAIRRKNIFFTYETIEKFDFALECKSKGFDIYNGSLRTAIAYAIFMNFKEVILVGCDYTHYFSKSMHWYEKGEGVLIPKPDYDLDFFVLASKYIKITTLTLEGGSKILPYVTYKDYTCKDPIFKENLDLIDFEDAKILSTWDDYKIFNVVLIIFLFTI